MFENGGRGGKERFAQAWKIAFVRRIEKLPHLPLRLHSFPLPSTTALLQKAAEGSNERSLPVRQWPTKRETIRCVSTRPHRRSRPSSRAPPPISRPSFSLTLRRMKERKREKSPCKSMDPRLFCAEQSFVSFLSR